MRFRLLSTVCFFCFLSTVAVLLHTAKPAHAAEKPQVDTPANPVTFDPQKLVASLPVTGRSLVGDDGSTTITVTYTNGSVIAKVADSPKATPKALTAIVAVPASFAKDGTSASVTVKTTAGTSDPVSYTLETPEQTIKRVVQGPAQTVVTDALHAAETPQQAVDRISGSLPAKDKAILADAFQAALKQGFQLSTPNVKNNVSVHAVMLPFDICKAVFGGEIAQRYTAIEVIVSNRTADAALIVQNIYIDYLEWGLAGGLGGSFKHDVAPYEAGSEKGHIASVESRLVRGDLLDASVWSKRNITIRALQIAGTLAAGYQFSIKEKGILKGIGAFNGQVIPGAQAFWPDSSTAQANRISDFGFQVNKVVAKQSAELIVAFYPVSRFLTPGLQAIFRKAPALLATPTSVAFDKNAYALLTKYAPEALPAEDRELVQKYLKDPTNNANADGHRLNDFLNSFSLNHVRVVVSGIMTVDIATIPPSVEEIVMDGGNTAATWAEAGTKTGTVNGKYLTGSDIAILNAAAYGITGAAAVPTGSTDTALKIQFTLSKPVPADTVLTVTLTKKTTVDGQNKTLTSNPYLLRVTYNPPQPKITAVTADASKVTITGTDLYDVNATLAVGLHPTVATGLADVSVGKDAITIKPTEIDIDLTKVTLQPACWTPSVSISGVPVPGATAFAQPAKPTVTAAKVNGARVVVTGTGFLDLSSCKSKLEFQVQNGTAAGQAVKNLKIDSPTQVSFDSPDMSSGTWSVKALVDGQQKATITIPKSAAAAPKTAKAPGAAAPVPSAPAAAPKTPVPVKK